MTERRAWIIYGAVWCVWHLLVFLSEPGAGPHIWNHEEAMSGNLARALVEGLALPVWHYQYAPHTHGTLIYGLLLAPLYAIFGSSIFWVKALGLAFAAAGTFFWIALVRRAFGLRVAAIFAAWWLCAPPGLVHMQHLAWANHMESIAWIGAMLWIFLNADETDPGRGRFALLGALAGFASFFCLQSLLVAGVLAALTVWRWRASGLRALAIAAPAFAIAYSPHWFYQRAMFRTLQLEAKNPDWASRIQSFFTVLPEAFEFSWKPVAWLAVGVLAIGFAIGLRDSLKNARRTTIPAAPWILRAFVGHQIVFFAAAVFSTFAVESYAFEIYRSRYLTPLFATMMALAAVAIAKWPKVLAALVVAPLLVAGVHDARVPGTIASVVAQTQDAFPGRWMWDLRGDNMRAIIEQNASFAWGNALQLLEDRDATWKAIAGQIGRLPSEWRAAACEVLAFDHGDDAPDFVRASCGPGGNAPWQRGLGRRRLKAIFDGAVGDPPTDVIAMAFADVCAAPGPDLARGFAFEFLTQYEVRTRERFRMEDAESTRDAIDRVAGADAIAACAGPAMAHAIGRMIAELELGAECVSTLARFTPFAPTAEMVDAFEDGYASGQAMDVITRLRCLTPNSLARRSPRLEAHLAELGLRLELRGDRECVVSTGANWTRGDAAPTMTP